MITSKQNPLVKKIEKLQKSASYRKQEGLCVIEGIKMVQEAKEIHSLFATESLLSQFPKAMPVADDVMKKMSALEAPEGVLALVKIPKEKPLQGKILALDRVSDPGNVGTLIRTALAFGWDGVLLLGESADPYGDKALRAAKGATFRIPLLKGGFDALNHLKNTHILYGALLAGKEPASIKEQNIVLVIGNEASGISPEILPLLKPITLPRKGEMESLNAAVAGAILLYLLQ